MTCDKNMLRTGAVLALALVVSACTSGPELHVGIAPQDAVSERQYGAIATDHPIATDLVREALEAKGGMSVDDGWRVQATLAVRPVTVGAFSDAPARDGEWSESPRISGARRGAMLHVLSVVLERAEGSQHRVVQVSARSDELETPDELLRQLAQAAATAAYEGAQTGPVQTS